MPVMDGQVIRANAQWAELPIIAVTANADQHHRDLCQHTGMNDFIAKPVDPDLLANTILERLIPIKQATEINPE